MSSKSLPRYCFAIARAALPLLALACFSGLARGQAPASVSLNWLDGHPPAVTQGVSWGVPWPKGTVKKTDNFVLQTAAGQSLPVQTWPTAYWPDGSVMWSGHSITAVPDMAGPFQLAVGTPVPGTRVVSCTEEAQAIVVDTGKIRVRLPKQGANLIESISAGGREVAKTGRLLCKIEDRSSFETSGTTRIDEFVSRIKAVTLEQSGPVRAVVKIEGDHKATASDRAWLPFVVRLYFTADSEAIRVVHSIVFDGDAQKDFIKGLGLSFAVPLREEVINRHVRLGGDEGMWAEPVKPMVGRREILVNDERIFVRQLAGQRVPNADQYPAPQQQIIGEIAMWDDYKLTQANAHGYVIEKRTQSKSSWLHVTEGRRALGLAFLGDVSGGLAVDVRKFWQKNPAALEIHGATSSMGELRVWLWSPDSPAMDLRHYDTRAHGLEMAYEDWKEGWDAAYGVANTTELTLWACESVPANAALVKMAETAAAPAMLVCAPQYYHDQRAFGYWSLPDRSSAARRAVEDQLENAVNFYRDEVDQRSWYGFWDYGDMMRMYDEMRHQWRYDIGGWAWNNTELLPDYWLWYSFLRTGRADLFRLAEAMTRHTSEVDVHHIGRFAPLGSRHNVRHWGDGAKQPRISLAGLKRFYYFLSTDERTGDLMREQLTADSTYAEVKRNDARAPERREYTTAAFGTDWSSYCSNWLTEYERTLDPKWLNKIKAGMDSQLALAATPGELLGGGPYDPTTGRFMPRTVGADAGPRKAGPARAAGGPTSFDLLFGTVEVMSEMELVIDHPEYWKAWRNFASRTPGQPMAYAAYVTRNAELGRQAAQVLLGRGGQGGGVFVNFGEKPKLTSIPDLPYPVQELAGRPEVAGDAHRLLILLEALDWVGEYLPKD